MIGEIISHYRVIGILGSGGMGEVFKAEDTRLGRQVALKFLSPDLARDPAALERFQREARAASGLNHPNICTIYDVGEHLSRPFIVMELIEGQTLRERLAGGRLATDLVLDWGAQVADALDAAHSRGIVHRDIKPANIFISNRGLAKVLDFGLAKQAALRKPEKVGNGDTATQLTTDDLLLTSPGSALGTIAYMSPEQARGEDLDGRADIFSLGAVLYEMATGRPAFAGNTSAVIFEAILNRQPTAATAINAILPSKLDEIMRKALEKDRGRRYQAAADLRNDLRHVERDTPSSPLTEATARPSFSSDFSIGPASYNPSVEPANLALPGNTLALPLRQRLRWSLPVLIGLLIAIAGSFIGLALHNRYERHDESVFMKMMISPVTSAGDIRFPVVSGDGKWLAFVQPDHESTGIYVRQLATGSTAQVVPPTGGMFMNLSYSPDGNFLYFIERDAKLNHSALYQVPSLAGQPRQILFDVDSPISFAPDGKQIVFVRQSPDNMTSSVMVANVDGSGERRLARLTFPAAFSSSGPAWSPDGKRVAVERTAADGSAALEIETIAADSGAETPLMSSQRIYPAQISWLRDGSGILVTLSNSSSFNAQIWKVTYPAGNLLRITNDLNYYAGTNLTSDGATLVTSQLSFTSSLSVAGVGSASPFSTPRLITSGLGRADGLTGIAWVESDRILYSYYTSGALRIASVSSKGNAVRDLTFSSGSPVWPSYCGRSGYFVFTAFDSSGQASVWRANFDGGNQRKITAGPADLRPSCSVDGKLVFYQDASAGVSRLKRISIEGGSVVQIGTEAIESPAVSPDGSSIAGFYSPGPDKPARLATVGSESGELQNIYTLPRGTDEAGEDGTKIVWSKDGRSILFLVIRNGTSNLWAQPVTPAGKITQPPRQVTNFASDMIWSFALSPAGGDIVFARGRRISDAVLISRFQ